MFVNTFIIKRYPGDNNFTIELNQQNIWLLLHNQGTDYDTFEIVKITLNCVPLVYCTFNSITCNMWVCLFCFLRIFTLVENTPRCLHYFEYLVISQLCIPLDSVVPCLTVESDFSANADWIRTQDTQLWCLCECK